MELGLSTDVLLKGSFLAHFLFSTWGATGSWCPESYLFYNLLLFITVFWTLHCKESHDAPLLGFFIDVISILLDIMILSMHFPGNLHPSSDHFGSAMAILNLFLRLLSSFVFWKIWADRVDGRDGTASSSHAGYASM